MRLLKKIGLGLAVALALSGAPRIAYGTVSNTTVQTTTAYGNGSNQDFTITFDFRANSWVTVTRVDDSTTPSTRTSITQGAGAGGFTITGGNPGTTVHMGTAPTSTQYLIIQRNIPLTQGVVFNPASIFPYAGISALVDQITLELQNLNASIGGSSGGSGGGGSSGALPTGVGYNLLGWNSSGSSVVNYPNSTPSTNDILKFSGSTWAPYSFTQSNLMSTLNGAPNSPLSAASGGSGVTNSGNFTWGSNPITLTTTGTTNLTLPTSGTLISGTATNNNTASTIVSRDGSGNFSAGTISANLTGNVTGNVTGNLTGNATGTAANVTGVVALGNGGTGQTTRQSAINGLLNSSGAGSGTFARFDGSNVTLDTLHIQDVPQGFSRAKLAQDTANTLVMNDSSGNMSVLTGVASGNVPIFNGVSWGVGTPTAAIPTGAVGSILIGQGASQPVYSATPSLGVAGSTLGTLAMSGNTSGTITIKPQAAAGTYNFNLPTTAGTNGQLLASAGGGSNAMTWVDPGGTGTVTSVGLSVPATSIFGVTGSPVTSTGTLGLTTAGTSGGIPYFSSTSQLASSSLLTAHGVVLGGGAGAAPGITAVGASNTVLHGNTGADPTYSAVSLTADVSGTLPVGNGGTGITSGTSGGIPYYSATNTLASSGALTAHGVVVGGGAGTTPTATGAGSSGQPLLSGGASADPAYGTLGVGAGGTGLTSGTSGGIPYFSSTSAITSSAALTAHGVVIGGGAGTTPTTTSAGSSGQVLTSNGASADPTFQAIGTIRSYVVCDTSNGYGSTTSQKIIRLTNCTTTGSGITYADSATAGATFTVVTPGLYEISIQSGFSSTGLVGISINSNQLTTSIDSITQANRGCYVFGPSADATAGCTFTVALVANDVIRPHFSGASLSSVTANTKMRMVQIGN